MTAMQMGHDSAPLKDEVAERFRAGRRVPMGSVSGSTPEATDALRLLFYLREADRQADLFNRAFADAMEAAGHNDLARTWQHLQAALFAAIVVNRLVANDSPRARGNWSKEQAREAATWRVRELRRVLELPPPEELDTPIYTVAEVRHSLEHIDERIDMAMWSPGATSLTDWYLSGGVFLMSPEQAESEPGGAPAGLRAFYPEAGLLYFDRTPLDLFRLDIDMLVLRANAREAMDELAKRPLGRTTYGGGQMIHIGEDRAAERFHAWQTQRAEVARDVGSPVPKVSVVLVEAPPDT